MSKLVTFIGKNVNFGRQSKRKIKKSINDASKTEEYDDLLYLQYGFDNREANVTEFSGLHVNVFVPSTNETVDGVKGIYNVLNIGISDSILHGSLMEDGMEKNMGRYTG